MVSSNNWESTPWAVGGGAKHSVSIGRMLAYVGFRGEEGIVQPKDCEVRETSTPGSQVRVFPGAVGILNRAPGGNYESYAGRLLQTDLIDIAGQGSSGPRSDLIVARVEDPFVAGSPWPTPTQADVDAGNVKYIKTAVISGVPAGTKTVPSGLGYSAIPLALVTLPASTSTITQAMITDLRKIVSNKTVTRKNVAYPTAARVLSATTWTDWPPEAGFSVDIPSWATHVSADAILGGIAHPATAGTGALRITLDALVLSGTTSWNFGAGAEKDLMLAGATKTALPAALRGTTVTAKIQGQKATSGAGNLTANVTSGISFGVTFTQEPETNL